MTSEQISDTLARLGAKQGVIQQMVKCPVHTDQHPSLSLTTKDGNFLYKCHRGCTQESITEWIKSGQSQTPYTPPARNSNSKVGIYQTQKDIEALYPYLDATGTLLYRVVRYKTAPHEPKDFAQQRPDGKGGWILGRNGIPSVLYKLPEVIAEVGLGKTVFVVEGEKDVESLRAIGIPATSNVGGAANKWLPEYSETLRGANVVILPDNDQPGCQHALKVAESLKNVAKTIKVVELLNLPAKGDVTDWLNAGGTAEQLISIVNSTTEYRQSLQLDSTPLPSAASVIEFPQNQLQNSLISLNSSPRPPAAPDRLAFHGLAGEWIDRIAPHTEADPAALLIEFLLCFGNAIGRSAHIPIGGTQHYGNLFAVIVGDTSRGAKGTSWGEISRLYRHAFPEWAENCIQSGLSTGEGLIHAVRDPLIVKEPVKDKGKIVEYQDVIKEEGAKDKRLMVVEEEFAKTLIVAKRDNNTLSPVVRQAWDRGNLNIMTRQPYSATNAHISILGQITPTELKRELTDTETGNGFANRFLWAYSESPHDLPFGGTLWQQNLDKPLNQLRDAIQFGQMQEALTWSDDARPYWGKLYPLLKEDRPGLKGVVTARARPQILRLSLLYALLDGSKSIRQTDIEAAVAVWDYCERTADYLFDNTLGDPTADTILSALRGQPSGMTRTAISGLFRNNKSADEISRALQTLLDNQLVLRESLPPSDNNKRSVENWRAA